jgi:FKBP-type peptidyl-prolyl cis-trans isomerase SlyD
MTNNPSTVIDGIVVSMDYTLRLDDGQVADTSEGREPLAFMQGQNQIISGLENALYGMAVGEEKAVDVAPKDGYGEINPDAYQDVPPSAFPSEMALTVGQSLTMQHQSTGQIYQARIDKIEPGNVRLDFNHPLAGENLHFHVKIVGLRQATEQEIVHGHVHDGSTHH